MLTFSDSSCQTEPVATMYDQTIRCPKWKIQTDELQTGNAYISAPRHVRNAILTFIFGIHVFNRTGAVMIDQIIGSRKWKVRDGRLKTGKAYIYTSRLHSNGFWAAISRFTMFSTPTELLAVCETKPAVQIPRRRPPNRKFVYLSLPD